MLRAVLFIFSILFYMSSTAQFYDRSWIVGAGQALVKLTFNGSSFDTASYYFNTNGIGINSASSDVSDTAGNILFYTNGAMVANGLTQIMENGDSLIDSLFYIDYQAGFVEPQTNLILPKSGNTFYLFYYSESDSLYASQTIDEPDRLYYAVVDMNQNGGLGKVISKKNVAYKGLFGDSRLTATRHANGRDWWLVHQGFQNDEYFIYLVTPDSIYGPNIQKIGPSGFFLDNESAQSTFSPDGSKFATVSLASPLLLMDFDRCTGLFSNPDSIFIPVDSFWYNGVLSEVTYPGGTGLSFSANGRFLYLCTAVEIYQFDTWASNVDSSQARIGRWDSVGPANSFFAFYQMYLMPNGQIIGDNFDGGDYFQLIDSPDVAGTGCGFIFDGLPTRSYASGTLPNMINYQLGALVGSGCDTLTGVSPTLLPGNDIFTFAPVPASEYLLLTYHATSDFTVKIYTVTGQKMAELSMQGDGSAQYINIDSYTTGIYYYEIVRNNAVLKRGDISIIKY